MTTVYDHILSVWLSQVTLTALISWPAAVLLSLAGAAARRTGRRARGLSRTARAARWTAVTTTVLVLAAVFSLAGTAPAQSAFQQRDPYPASGMWVPIDSVSPTFLAAVTVHEDPKFYLRPGGTDWAALYRRAKQYRRSGERQDPLRSTTIPQQLAKNLFLDKSRTLLRKGILEPVLAEALYRELGPRRVLELYINFAEFGKGIWGVCNASWLYFHEPPSRLTVAESAELVAVLPMPKYFRPAMPGPGVVPLARPVGTRFTPSLLLAWSRRNVPPQIARENVLRSLQAHHVIASDVSTDSNCNRRYVPG